MRHQEGRTLCGVIRPCSLRTERVMGLKKPTLEAELHLAPSETMRKQRERTGKGREIRGVLKHSRRPSQTTAGYPVEGGEEASEAAKIICLLCLVLRKRLAGERVVWEVEEEGGKPDHEGEQSPYTHETSLWALEDHPVLWAGYA